MRRARLLTAPFALTSLVVVASAFVGAGCTEKPKYKAEPAYSGTKASIPAVPKIPAASTFKNGSDWTIYGLQHQLNNPRHRAEVDGKALSIVGYVVKVYRPEEPKGKEGCVYPTKAHPPTSKEPTPKGVDCGTVKGIEPPHFWIADNKDEKNPTKWVMVEGYASTYIQLAMAIDWYKPGQNHKIDSTKEDDLFLDNNYSSHITILGEPKVGSKVVVSGQFGSKYSEGMGGSAISPYGIIDITSNKKGKLDFKEGELETPTLK